jgi:DUF1016 N-terminal domain
MLYGSTGKKRTPTETVPPDVDPDHDAVLAGVNSLLEAAHPATARSVNSIMTATYWDIGSRIVELEQAGWHRAAYGTRLIETLSFDLTKRFGGGLGIFNLAQMRKFYQTWLTPGIIQTASEELSLGDRPTAERRARWTKARYVHTSLVNNRTS